MVNVGLVSLGVIGAYLGFTHALDKAPGGLLILNDEFLTYHRGDDQNWRDDQFSAFSEWNSRQNRKTLGQLGMGRLTDRIAARAKGRLPGTRPRRQSRLHIEGRKLIFCSNPGRSGSAFLAKALNRHPSIRSHHEAAPFGGGPWIRRVSWFPEDDEDDYSFKLAQIGIELSSLRSREAYAETNHLFIKTWGKRALEYFGEENTSVIALHRPWRQVVQSFIELGYLTGSSSHWHNWFIHPLSEGCLCKVKDPSSADVVDLILAYLVDHRKRQVKLRDSFPAANWIDTSLEVLNGSGGIERLFTDLGFDPELAAPRRNLKPVNSKIRQKEHIGIEADTGLLMTYVESDLERQFSDDDAQIIRSLW